MRMPAGADLVNPQRLEAVLPIEGHAACVVLRNPKPDDIMQMRPRNKFLAQIVVALISMAYGFHIAFIHNPGHSPSDVIYFPWWVGYPLTLLWYLGMMNALNFIDGLDGLLSGVTAISGLFLFITAVTHGSPIVALVVAALVGSARNVRLDIARVRVTRAGARVDLERGIDGRANIDDAKLKSGGLRTQHYADGAQKCDSTNFHG